MPSSNWLPLPLTVVVVVFVAAVTTAFDAASTSNRDVSHLADKDELIRVLPGQFIGGLVTETRATWLFNSDRTNVKRGFAPPIFDYDAAADNEFAALQRFDNNSSANPPRAVHVLVKPFPPSHQPLLHILASTRCGSPSSASYKLQSRVALLLNVNSQLCERSHAQQRLSLVEALTAYFSHNMANYWWLAQAPVFEELRLTKMVMTMLESSNSDNYSNCTLVMPLGCGAHVPGSYIDSVVKLQDELPSFPAEIRQALKRWSVKIFDPLMLPALKQTTSPSSSSSSSKSSMLMRNQRNRYRRQAFGLSRSSLWDSYSFSDYLNDESFENRLAADASSGFGEDDSTYQPPQPPQSPDVFDVLTMVASTTTESRFDSVESRTTTPLVPTQDIVEEQGDFVDETTPAVNVPEYSYPEVTLTRDEPVAIVAENFPTPLRTSTPPPTPWPEYSEDSVFIAEHKILHYPIRRRFESLSDDPRSLTFILNQCSSPFDNEPVSSACEAQTISIDDWLYYNPKMMALEGVVPSKADSIYLFNLTAFSNSQALSFIIRISVVPASRNPQIARRTHEFCLHLRTNSELLGVNDDDDRIVTSQLRMRDQVKVARVVASSTPRMNLDDIAVLSVKYKHHASLRRISTMCFTQLSLTPVDGGRRCPVSMFASHLGHAVVLPATWRDRRAHRYSFQPSESFASALGNATSYQLTSVAFNLYHACKHLRMDVNQLLNVTSAQLLSGSGAIDEGEGDNEASAVAPGDVWMTLVIPGAVLFAMLLLALLVACLLYRCLRRKSRGGATSKRQGNNVFLTKGVPAIFQEELDSEGPGQPTRLLIAADSRDQYSGSEDTASSTAPGGSPGRVMPPSSHQVPATPPPPEYQHRLRKPSPQKGDEGATSTTPEVPEVGRPLLVKLQNEC